MSDVKTDIEQLYKDCYQRMLNVARLMLKNDDEASDTVSDVFRRADHHMYERKKEMKHRQ